MMTESHTKKTYRLEIVVKNVRTSATETRSMECDGHGKLGKREFESFLTWGSRLYAKGWDHQEFSIDSAEVTVREVLDVKYRK